MNVRLVLVCGFAAAICAAVSEVRAGDFANVELPELNEEEALALGVRRVKVSESTVVIATQGERLLVEFDRSVIGLRATRKRWPGVMLVSGESRKFVVSSSHSGDKFLSVSLVDRSAILVQFVFLKGRRLPLESEEKTTMSVVGHNGREKRFSVSAGNVGDLQSVMRYLLPDDGLTIEQQNGRLVLRGQVPSENDRSRLFAVARCFFPIVDNQLVTADAPASGSKPQPAVVAEADLTDRKVRQLTLEVEQLRHRVQELTAQPQMSVSDDEPMVYRSDRTGFTYTPSDCLVYFHRSFAGEKDPVVRALSETSGLYVVRPWQDVDGMTLGYELRVRTNPTLILMRDKKEVGRIEGEFTDDQVKQLLESQ